MKFSGWAGLALAAVAVLVSGCGDTFRPVATPLPQPSPDPQTVRLAVFTSCVVVGNDCSSSSPVPGTATDVDVSGDTVAGVTVVGRSPVNALVGSSLVVTADRDNNTVTSYSRSALAPTTILAPTTTGLPSGAAPTALISANGAEYVAESGRGVVGVLGGFPLAITAEVPVGTNPVDLTVLPNGKKIYVTNAGSNSVSVIDTTDNSLLTTISDPLASTPVWAVPSADSTHVYVVNQGSSNVTVIDATTDSVTATLAVGSTPNYAVFDVHNQRVVVTNPGSGTISVITADPTSPLFNTVKNVTVGTNPRSVTALADGTRLYVANTGSNSVSVVSNLSLAVSKTIPVGTTPVSISSDAESAKVLVANRDSFNLSIINTSTDSEVSDASGKPVRILAPQQDPACVPSATVSCPRLNPVFVAVGPG